MKIETPQALRQLYSLPEEPALRKCLPRLDVHSRRFISLSPFLVLSTYNGADSADVSPRGDFPGFVEVLDDNHLLLPDRPGNNRLDSLINILSCPHVGLLFFIPGMRETLRVNGIASITADPDLLAKHAVEGKTPKTALLIEVTEMFLHCAKALLRSKLWKPETWPEKDAMPSAGRIWADQIRMGITAEAIDQLIADRIESELY